MPPCVDLFNDERPEAEPVLQSPSGVVPAFSEILDKAAIRISNLKMPT